MKTVREQARIALRVAGLVLGAWLAYFGWHKAHGEVANLQTPTQTGAAYGPEFLVVGGVLVILMAFLPSPARLGRWMSRKRRKPVPHARFRRQHKS
jgi:hypothetical protein